MQYNYRDVWVFKFSSTQSSDTLVIYLRGFEQFLINACKYMYILFLIVKVVPCTFKYYVHVHVHVPKHLQVQ